MAHYAKISNDEFTVSERARLSEAESEKSAIEANNIASDEYAALKTTYDDSFTSANLQTLEGELSGLQSQYTPEMTEEEREALNASITEKQAEIDTEKAALVPGQETALASLNAKEAEGTEDVTAEIETLNTTIANALCRVTKMKTGVDEIEMVNGDSAALEAEIKTLEESKKNYPYNRDTDETKPSELTDIENQIQAKIKEIDAIPKVEKDNTVYWEGFYGGCKRTSYNTKGGVHTLGGTPFRKNYAGVGYIYDLVRDAFYIEQPYDSWTLDESTCYWQPPTPPPEGRGWYWKEDTTEWVDYVYINPDNNQPYPSWTWDTANGTWNPPVECPSDGREYYWVEETLTWVER